MVGKSTCGTFDNTAVQGVIPQPTYSTSILPCAPGKASVHQRPFVSGTLAHQLGLVPGGDGHSGLLPPGMPPTTPWHWRSDVSVCSWSNGYLTTALRSRPADNWQLQQLLP